MKKYAMIIGLMLWAVAAFAQQKEAKEVLERTSGNIQKAGGVKASFEVESFHRGELVGQAAGMIQMKGEKFMLSTNEIVTWYDGNTQWSYLTNSDEVNVSNPTAEEIRGLNPYSLLSLYKEGYAYRLGSIKNRQGKAVTEVILTATAGQELSLIHLYVNPKNYQPLFMEVTLKDGTKTDIVITNYQSGLSFPDTLFWFDRSKYPTAEIIDLR